MDAAERTDYVVIETSGVADPVGLVQSLEKRYGRLTRARLDAVVVVADADLLAHQLGLSADGAGAERGHAAGEGAALQRLVRGGGADLGRQLSCADVVLLNKAEPAPPLADSHT